MEFAGLIWIEMRALARLGLDQAGAEIVRDPVRLARIRAHRRQHEKARRLLRRALHRRDRGA